MSSKQELVYFSDPMCSWCYGFGPEIEKLRDHFSDRVGFTMIMGGLRPDETKPTPESMAKEITTHWEHVRDASGRIFDFSFFEQHPDFVYDTAPSSRAVVAAGRVDNERRLTYQHRLQRLFYAQAEDPTKVETFEKAAVAVEMDPVEFRKMYDDPETEQAVRQGFVLTRQLGIYGYPTLVLHMRDGDEEKYVLLSRGYDKFENLRQRVDLVLNNQVKLVPEGQS